MSAILIDTCSCKKKEILKIKEKYSKLKKITHRSFRNISCGLDVFYDIKMKAFYKLKKKHITLILTKKADSKILKGNTLLQPVRWQASPIPTKK